MTHSVGDEALLETLLGPMSERIRDVNLPLHILLEGRFGDLNDNQLEMIHAAQDAALDANRILRMVLRLRELRGLQPRQGADAVRCVDLMRAPLLLALARADELEVKVDVDIPPDLPHVAIDRSAVEEAMASLLVEAVSTQPGGRLRITGSQSDDRVHLRIGPWHPPQKTSLELLIAELLVGSCLGSVVAEGSTLAVGLVMSGWPSAGD